MTFYQMVWYFFLYAFLGWCVEVVFCTVNTGKLVNRGFLNGPLCPIYGFGMLAVLLCLLPLKENLLVLYIGSFLLTSAIELFGGFALKKLFHTSWWDYSDQPFNIGGYVCLKFSIAWGFGGVLAVDMIHPLIEKLVALIPHVLGIIVLIVLSAVCVCDLIVTVMAVKKMNRDLGLITDVAQGLRSGSDALSKNIGENALAADEKLDAVKQGATEKLGAVKQETTEKLDTVKQETAEKLATVKQETARRMEALRAEWQKKQHPHTVSARLLRAFPNMKADSHHSEALNTLRGWYAGVAGAHTTSSGTEGKSDSAKK